MNFKDIMLSVIPLWISLHLVKSDCKNEHLTVDEANRQNMFQYDRKGNSEVEKCNWQFNFEENEDVVLMLTIKSFLVHTKNWNNNYVILPNGTRFDSRSSSMFINKCMRFRKKGLERCLKYAKEDRCDAPITEATEWPPVLKSSTKSTYKNSNDYHIYPMKLNFFYRFVNCTNSSREHPLGSESDEGHFILSYYFITTVALSCVVAIISLVALFSIFLLCRKLRSESEIEHSESLKRIKDPQVEFSDSDYPSCKKITEITTTTTTTTTPGNNYSKVQKKSAVKKEEEEEEATTLVEPDSDIDKKVSGEKEAVDFPNNTYSRIGGSQFTLADDDPDNIYADISNKQVVENELYDSYTRA